MKIIKRRGNKIEVKRNKRKGIWLKIGKWEDKNGPMNCSICSLSKHHNSLCNPNTLKFCDRLRWMRPKQFEGSIYVKI